jgi:hypothetical protein
MSTEDPKCKDPDAYKLPSFDQLREVFDELEVSKGLPSKPLPTRRERRAAARAQAKRLFREGKS